MRRSILKSQTCRTSRCLPSSVGVFQQCCTSVSLVKSPSGEHSTHKSPMRSMTTDTESCAAFQIAHMELDRVSVAAAGSKRQCDMQHAHMHVDIRQPTAKSDGEPPAGASVPQDTFTHSTMSCLPASSTT